MSLNPFMPAVRFLLELTAVVSSGILGWRGFDASRRFVLVLVLPIVVAAVWGMFAAPEDPSRNGEVTVVVPGVVRLVIEVLVPGGGAVALWGAGPSIAALVSAVVLVL
ncbi:DUF2568 domain-containing protein [Nocardia sp. NPDC046763]|uniref:DUF2568 domain-containing protein n=1 Tax=Nocardia sp. NPDC046763 TaxID=3155256 RepID=UPI00340E7B32